MSSPTHPALRPGATSVPAQSSHRYTARGERVDPAGGTYWIPERDFTRAVETARHAPETLNRYPFKRT